MDQRLQYEQLIAGKLESLPIPDMQDAIWSRIKAQLDIDMPTDDGGGDAGPQSPSGPGIIGWGLSVLLLAVLTVFFLSKNKSIPAEDQSPATTVESAIAPAESANAPPASPTPANTPASTPTNNSAAPGAQPVVADSLFSPSIAAEGPQPTDSIRSFNLPPAVTLSPPADTVKKKQRGVTGINPNDYRIVPKKDSL